MTNSRVNECRQPSAADGQRVPPKLSIILPVFNEAECLETLQDRLRATLDGLPYGYEIIFVNDGSTDGSGQLLDDLASRDRRLKAIHLRRNYGQTSAIMAGIDHSSGDTLVLMDADLQNDPADIPSLLAKLDEGFDVCSGWRRERQDTMVTRVLPSRLANWLISRVLGVCLNDYGCTLKAYRRSALEGVKLYGEMHRFLPAYASQLGAKVSEIPVAHRPRTFGKSNYGLGRTYKVVLDLIVVLFLGGFFQKPIYVFGGFGLCSFFASAASFAAMVYFKLWGGKSFVETPLPLLVVLFFLMGFISILLGLLAEVLVRIYYETQGKPPYAIRATRNLELDR